MKKTRSHSSRREKTGFSSPAVNGMNQSSLLSGKDVAAVRAGGSGEICVGTEVAGPTGPWRRLRAQHAPGVQPYRVLCFTQPISFQDLVLPPSTPRAATRLYNPACGNRTEGQGVLTPYCFLGVSLGRVRRRHMRFGWIFLSSSSLSYLLASFPPEPLFCHVAVVQSLGRVQLFAMPGFSVLHSVSRSLLRLMVCCSPCCRESHDWATEQQLHRGIHERICGHSTAHPNACKKL